MFDFIFGGSKKVQLVKDLIIFLDRGDYPSVEDLNRRQLFNTPEAIIVDLVSSIHAYMKKGNSFYKSILLTEKTVTLYGNLSDLPELQESIQEAFEKYKDGLCDVNGIKDYVYAKIATAAEKPFLGVLVWFTPPLEEEVYKGCCFVWEELRATR